MANRHKPAELLRVIARLPDGVVFDGQKLQVNNLTAGQWRHILQGREEEPSLSDACKAFLDESIQQGKETPGGSDRAATAAISLTFDDLSELRSWLAGVAEDLAATVSQSATTYLLENILKKGKLR